MLADPDADGVPLLMEYAQGLLPTVHDATTPGLKTIEIRDTVTSSSTLRRFLSIKVIFHRFSTLKKAPQL